LLSKVLPDSPDVLFRVARTYFAVEEQRGDRLRILRRAAELLAATAAPMPADHRLRGLVEVELGNRVDGAAWLERALTLDGTHADWFFEAATVYASLDDTRRAARYARQAWMLNPGDGRYRHLSEQLQSAIDSGGTTGTKGP
jgi:hypothetical protein